MYLPFLFKNFLCVELEDLAELFSVSKQQTHNITPVRVTALKVFVWHMQNKSEILEIQKSDSHNYVAYPRQAQKTLYP